MSSRHVPTVLFVGLMLTLLAKAAVVWSRLPERVAVHFDASGVPNGWSSRSGLSLTILVLMALFAASYLATGLIARVPDRLINLPRKAYWLAPERRAETLEWLAGWTRWFLVVTLAFLVLTFITVFEANLVVPPRLALPGWFIGGFIVVVVAMVAMVFWRFLQKA